MRNALLKIDRDHFFASRPTCAHPAKARKVNGTYGPNTHVHQILHEEKKCHFFFWGGAHNYSPVLPCHVLEKSYAIEHSTPFNRYSCMSIAAPSLSRFYFFLSVSFSFSFFVFRTSILCLLSRLPFRAANRQRMYNSDNSIKARSVEIYS